MKKKVIIIIITSNIGTCKKIGSNKLGKKKLKKLLLYSKGKRSFYFLTALSIENSKIGRLSQLLKILPLGRWRLFVFAGRR